MNKISYTIIYYTTYMRVCFMLRKYVVSIKFIGFEYEMNILVMGRNHILPTSNTPLYADEIKAILVITNISRKVKTF